MLAIISRSPTDVRPVFDAIAESAARLLGGVSALVALVEGDELRLAAATSTGDAGHEAMQSFYPLRLDGNPFGARVLRERIVRDVSDAENVPAEPYRNLARARGFRSQLNVPIIRGGEAIGLIAVGRREARASTANEIALLQTFADQAGDRD